MPTNGVIPSAMSRKNSDSSSEDWNPTAGIKRSKLRNHHNAQNDTFNDSLYSTHSTLSSNGRLSFSKAKGGTTPMKRKWSSTRPLDEYPDCNVNLPETWSEDSTEVRTVVNNSEKLTELELSESSESTAILLHNINIVRRSDQVICSKQSSNIPLERCARCYVPICILDSIEGHKEECEKRSLLLHMTCQSGVHCKELNENHYWAWKHLTLEESRSVSPVLTLNFSEGSRRNTTELADHVIESAPRKLAILHETNIPECVAESSKINYVQKWVDSCPLETGSISADQHCDPMTKDIHLNDINKTPSEGCIQSNSNQEIVDVPTPSHSKRAILTPKKKGNLSTPPSSGKQSTITSYFSTVKTIPKESHEKRKLDFSPLKSNSKQNELSNTGDETHLLPAVEFSHQSTAETFVTFKSNQKEAKAQWNGLMSRMRGTVENAGKKSDKPAISNGKCPFYKRIPDTGFAIDAFSYGHIPGVTCYFLSHFHYDHFRGIGKWLNKPLYCSSITANLVEYKTSVRKDVIRIMPLNEPRIIEDVEVVLLDANHCPGAVMFLFRFPHGKTILHVGDFRADPSMETMVELNRRPIDHIYLDTTYCNEYYNLPKQSEVLEYVKRLVRSTVTKYPKLLVVCGTYTIGKEKVFLAAAEELDCHIWAPAAKVGILNCLENPQLLLKLNCHPMKSQVHVVNVADITISNLKKYLTHFNQHFTHLLALLPTGWEYDDAIADRGLDSIRPKTYGNIFIYGIPYSEHSGFDEMKRFVCYFKPKKIIPTVGSVKERQKMEKYFNTWKNSF